MKCPVCIDTVLIDHELDEGLWSHRCAQCGGQWIESKRYWAWRESRPNSLPPATLSDNHLVSEPPAKARLCPECGRLLRRAPVGRGVDFCLDRCGHCGGIWFDANEWETLKQHGLHDEVHFVFSAAWQAQVAREQREAEHEKMLERKLGVDDYNEIRRIKRWLDGHPHRAELFAVLVTGVAGGLSKHGGE